MRAATSSNFTDTVSIPAGGKVVYTVTALISQYAIGYLSNTASIDPPVGTLDPVMASNSATDLDALGDPPTPVPAFSGVGMLILPVLLGGVAFWRLRRKGGI